MTQLAEILSSKIRSEIFRLLFGVNRKELHVREIERQTGFSIGTVRQELQKLVKLQLLKTRKDGNRLYYCSNREHPLFPDIRNLVLKTSGLVEVLKNALKDKGITIAFIFGSIATSQEGARSDVDLMVIGQANLRSLSSWLNTATEKIGRDINPHVLKEDEFKKRKNEGDHFLSTVLRSPRLFIIGNEDELATMGS
jgi:predicted nucleotidyltransferase